MADPLPDSQELKENRYFYLLQPIRDLAANWDIDIASELEEYLDELENITFALEGTSPSLNFAEAALLIQGTACVYSKKVEYLHNLVYQALETIFNKRHKERGDGAQRQHAGTNNDADDVATAFLHLDDLIKEAKTGDIDLDEDDSSSRPEVHRPPAALLALEDHRSGQGDGESGTYRLAVCSVHVSGALMLEAKDLVLYDEQLQLLHVGRKSQWREVPRIDPQAWQQGVDGQELNQLDNCGTAELDEDCNSDGGGADVYMDRTSSLFDLASAEPSDAGPSLPVMQVSVGPTSSAPAACHERGDGSDEDDNDAGFFDPYRPLDMHDTGSMLIRPMQVRKPRRGHHKSWKPPAPRPPGVDRSIHLFHDEFLYALPLLCQYKAAPTSRADRLNRKQRQHLSVFDQTDVQRAQVAEDGLDAPDAELGEGGEVEGIFEDDEHQGPGWENDGGDGDDGCGDGGLEDYWDGPSQGPSGIIADPLRGSEELSYEELCRSHIESLIATAAAQQTQTDLALRVSTWRHRIDPVLQMEEERHVFDIHEYGEKILERLTHLNIDDDDRLAQETNKRQSAKSSENGRSTQGHAIDFHGVVQAIEKHEVSRSFAAMLQLINNLNVAIHKGQTPDQPFRLELLSSAMLHKSMGHAIQETAKGASQGTGALPVSQGCENVMSDEPDLLPRKPAAKKARKGKAN